MGNSVDSSAGINEGELRLSEVDAWQLRLVGLDSEMVTTDYKPGSMLSSAFDWLTGNLEYLTSLTTQAQAATALTGDDASDGGPSATRGWQASKQTASTSTATPLPVVALALLGRRRR